VAVTGVATLLLALGASAPAFAAPDASLNVALAPSSPAPPVLNQAYAYSLAVGNTGDVALDNLVIVDTLPVELALSSVTTGSYSGLTDFAAGEGVRVSYEKNTAPGVFTLWGSSPNTTFNTTLTTPPPGLGPGEYVTRVRWEFGQAAAGMRATTPPLINGRVRNPDNAGGPVAAGDTIQDCATLSAVYTGGPTNVTRTDCESFTLIAGPSLALDAPASTPLGTTTTATASLSGGAPTGSVTFRVFAAGDTACATALSSANVTVNGVGAYTSPPFTAAAAGAYQWVARYNGDSLHAATASGCNNPAGAFAVVAPPRASAAFDAATVTVGEPTALTFTIANPAANTVPLTGVGLEIALPAGLVVASPNGVTGSCGGGTITAAAGSDSITLAGGTIPTGASCSFSVDVTAAEPGALTTTTGAVESANGGSGNAATAELTVRPAPTSPEPPATPSAPPAPPPPPASPGPPATPSPVPTGPAEPQTAQALALACSPRQLVLVSAREAGRRVRFRGVADPADAGQSVVIRASPGRAVAARATVGADGTFTATGRLPRRRALHATRYSAELGTRRSALLKLRRRMTARLIEHTRSITIAGRVAPPMRKPIQRVVIRRLTRCAAGYSVIARVKPDAHGRFRVRLPRAPGGALYRAQTQVRAKAGGPLRTLSTVLWE
jgi:uncharacterized repeat protein (TIGR01451 family)